ncbi:MAG: HAD-IA family hydrolase [Isosphaeraceae bacterium]|nr:HAD-IA family hydrolase [Isosphaeraceae bacterium]
MPETPLKLEFVFFDIGGTLLDRHQDSGDFFSFPSSIGLLKSVKSMGARVGIITTLGAVMTNADAWRLLRIFDLDTFIDPQGLVSDHDAGVAKPHPQIFAFAAARVGSTVDRCLFVGENLTEVIGARLAGMHAILKPCPPGRDLPG